MTVGSLIREKIIETLRENPEEDWWINKLVRELELNQATIKKYVDILEEEGGIVSSEEGKKRLLSLSESDEKD